MRLIVFEDEVYRNLLPLTYPKAAFELRVGPRTLLENMVERLRPEETVLLARGYLREVLAERYPWAEVTGDLGDEEAVLVNGLLYVGRAEAEKLRSLAFADRDKALVVDGRLAAAKLTERTLKKHGIDLLKRPEAVGKIVEAEEARNLKLITYLWELITFTSEVLAKELKELRAGGGEVEATVRGDPGLISVEEDSLIESGVTIDVRAGPVYVGRGVEVEAPTRIVGPAYIGDGSIIFGARVEVSVIGEVCRIGGEVSHTIIHRYSNKRHYGFLGHSYVGEWVNLGAGFTNSNLKNTYGIVRMSLDERKIDTGQRFLGCFIGDHVKASIGALVYGGKRIGLSSHIHGLIAEDVPSFTHYAKSLGQTPLELELESALETARRMMARRGVRLSEAEERLLRRVYEVTAEERRRGGVARGRISPF